MKILLYISSIVVFLFTGLFYFQENIFAEWRGHQLAYLRQLKQINQDSEHQEEENLSIKLQQIYLPEMNRIDRCVSCHVTIEDPRFADKKNPLKTHPGNYLEKHDPEKFGCTICHDGQGRAIVWDDVRADSKEKFWEKPIIKKPFLEANCFRCHVKPLSETPTYNRGKYLFETSGCLGCHKRDGRGGYLAAELRGLGDASVHQKYPTNSLDPKLLPKFNYNRNLAYIYESVRFPKAQPEDSVMFDFKFSHDDALALTVYLKSLSTHQPGIEKLPQEPEKPLTLLARGKKTFQLFCSACHGENGKGGVKNRNYQKDVMPTLNLIAEKMFLYEKEDADAVIEAINEFGDLNLTDPEPDIPGFNRVLAQFTAVRDIILNGNSAAKKDPEGPAPFNMPSWRKSIPRKDVTSTIAFMISLYDFEE